MVNYFLARDGHGTTMRMSKKEKNCDNLDSSGTNYSGCWKVQVGVVNQ
jgi:hypothetical protein